jgi:superfamily I DNA/RNA helicase
MPVLTHNQETVVGATGTEVLARRFLHLLKQGLAAPAEILVLLPSNRAVEALTDLIESDAGHWSLRTSGRSTDSAAVFSEKTR